MRNVFALIVVAPVLTACAAGGLYDRIDTVRTAVDGERREALERAENLRCRWPVHWIGDMARTRGEVWLKGYVANCPAFSLLIKSATDSNVGKSQ